MPWSVRAAYLRALGDAREALTREMDPVQEGRDSDVDVEGAVLAVLAARRRYLSAHDA